MEKKLRAKLEEEVRELREEGGNTSSNTNQDQDTELLLRKLSQAEEKVGIQSIMTYLENVGEGGGGQHH
jgi:hypothetical protein